MVEVPVDKLQLRDDKKLISPPSVVSPLYQCAKAITIFDFIPNATLDVQVDSTQVITGAPGGFPMPNGTTVLLPSALVLGQVVRARQNFGGATSNWSAPVTVRNHTIDYPTGPPRPEIEAAPVYKCGSRTGVNNLLTGCNVWITVDGLEVGRVDKNIYRFVVPAPELEKLKPGASISMGWAGVKSAKKMTTNFQFQNQHEVNR
jgi:hypothetical protein